LSYQVNVFREIVIFQKRVCRKKPCPHCAAYIILFLVGKRPGGLKGLLCYSPNASYINASTTDQYTRDKN
jgi:hypothetical protein